MPPARRLMSPIDKTPADRATDAFRDVKGISFSMGGPKAWFVVARRACHG